MTTPGAPEVRFLGPDYTEENFVWHDDCRHFEGGRPCRFWRPCLGCPHHDPVDFRVLIVMLGLHGDMLIASPLPARIKKAHPDAHITWLADDEHTPLLRMNPDIDRVLSFDWQAESHLSAETFDAVYSFERTPSAAALVDRIRADHKAGLAFGGPHNALYAMGEAARHFFKMNTWNDHRTILNTKTWTELYFEIAGYTYAGEPYVLRPPETAQQSVREYLPSDPQRALIGLNVGSSLTTKMWPESHWAELAAALLDQGRRIVFTGGPKEATMCERLVKRLSDGPGASSVYYRPLSLEEFCAVPQHCDVVVSGDTFGYHAALAYDRPCVVMFGPSYGAEVIPKHVDNVISLVSTSPCSPCAHQVACGGVGGCMDTIQPSAVLAAIDSHLRPSAATSC